MAPEAKGREPLVSEAREGNEEAIHALLAEFVSAVTAGWELDPAVLRYIAEQIDQQLAGRPRPHELGLPRRGRGRPAKRANTYFLEHALANDPEEAQRFRLALAVAQALDQGEKLHFAREGVADRHGCSVMQVRRAWERWGDDATWMTLSIEGGSSVVLASLTAPWGHCRVFGRLTELQLANRRSVWPLLVEWIRAGTPPEQWAAPRKKK